MEDKKIRLRKSVIYGTLITCLLAAIIIFVICICLTDFGVEWLYCFAVAFGLMSIPALIAIVSLVFECPYFIVNENEIKKYKRRKLLLSVKCEDITNITIIANSKAAKLLTPFWFFIGAFPCDMIGIEFANDNDEFDFQYSRWGLGTRTFEGESNLKINLDLLSRKEAKKLAELINKPIYIEDGKEK